MFDELQRQNDNYLSRIFAAIVQQSCQNNLKASSNRRHPPPCKLQPLIKPARPASPHPCLLCAFRFTNKSVDEIDRLGNTNNYERKQGSVDVGVSGEYIDTKKMYSAISPDNGQSSTSMIILSNLNLLKCLIALRHSCHSPRRIGI